jgi:hypothetical protein
VIIEKSPGARLGFQRSRFLKSIPCISAPNVAASQQIVTESRAIPISYVNMSAQMLRAQASA